MKRGCFLLNYIALIVLLCPSITLSDVPSIVNDTIDTQHLAVADREFGYDFLHAYRTALRNGLRGVQEATRKNETTECERDVKYLLNNNTELLMKYVDAIGKPRSGYLRGNVMWLGSYSECQDIPNAQYCTTTLVITAPTLAGAFWSLCFPKSCSSQDVGMYLNKILKEVETITQHKISVNYKDVMCPAEKPTYTTGVKVTIALCGVLLFLCLIATVVDYLDETFNISPIPKHISDITATDSSLMNHTAFNTSIEVDGVDNTGSLTADDVVLLNSSDSVTLKIHFAVVSFKGSGLGQFFQCFSVLQNTAKILKTDVTPSAIRSINGIRVISITWVILGHAFSTAVGQLADNRAGAVKDSQSLSMMAILSGTYSVDSFFFLSGLLVAYTCFRKLERNDGSFNWVLFYVHRFWRLTPSYMFVILFSVHLKGFLTESPFWYTQFTDPLCSKNWWTNLLYINNFYPKSAEDCIGWSWYLANDMQFFVISPFLIYPLFKVGWRGLVLPLGLLLEAFVITGFIHAHWDLDPIAILRAMQWLMAPKPETLKSLNEYMKYVYFKPYCRIQVYLVGLLLGYVMHRYGKSKTRTPGWITTLLGWSIAFVVAMLLVYGPHKSILPGAEQWNAAEKVIFGTFHRFLWGLVLAWVTYACHYGAGGLVQKFLSARFWIPLSRLTYNVYLIHYIILILMFYGAKGTLHYDLYTATYYFLASVVLSYGAAYVLAVVIEFPCANLEELVLKCIRKVRKRGD